MISMQDSQDKDRPNTMQNGGGIIRKMKPDLESATPAIAGGLLKKKRVHYEGDPLNRSS